MANAHAFTGLFPGDHFIHRFNFDGQITFAYGFLRAINAAGHYEADYQCQTPPTQPTSVDKEAHVIVGRISKKAYALARLRNWPNTQPQVDAIIAYSAGKPADLSAIERARLLLVK